MRVELAESAYACVRDYGHSSSTNSSWAISSSSSAGRRRHVASWRAHPVDRLSKHTRSTNWRSAYQTLSAQIAPPCSESGVYVCVRAHVQCVFIDWAPRVPSIRAGASTHMRGTHSIWMEIVRAYNIEQYMLAQFIKVGRAPGYQHCVTKKKTFRFFPS